MNGRNRGAVAVAATVGFVLGLGASAGRWVHAQAPVVPTAPQAFAADDPPNRGLDANLFMQTSAEYRACCLQAFNLATARLAEGVKNAGRDKKPAVVIDLDETVFDNAGFQAMQLRSGLAYDQRLWTVWEQEGSDRIGLVPGAKPFLDEAARLGVAVVYLSNRNASCREQTRAAIERLGLPAAEEEDLKLADRATGSNKASRRAEAEKKYRVILHVGDNLRDFDERFRFPDLTKATPEEREVAIRQRKAEVDATASEWGKKWVILPNPAYGEWTKPLGRGKADLDRLVPAAEK